MRTTLFLLIFAICGIAGGSDPVLMLPDPALTPGKVAGGSRDLRGVTFDMQQRVFARYRIPRERQGQFKIDHLIPMELGGADDISNLWPQPLKIRPYNPHRKELLGKRLLELVAAGSMTRTQAQELIRRDWISAYVDYIGIVYLAPGAGHSPANPDR
ncbi:MAG: hypothetical protein ABI944_02505 [Chthoniobacterales bacterium]